MENLTNTKAIREAVAYFCTLPKTNKFKRALDVALAQSLPLEITAAPPFKGYRATLKNGRKVKFKVKVKNTRTGEFRLLNPYRIEGRAGGHGLIFRGCHFGASLSFGKDYVYGMARNYAQEHKLIWTEEELAAAEYTLTGEHTIETSFDGPTSWGALARAVSDLCKQDFAHTEPCGKCSGTGFLPHYAHIDNGTCWDCMGCGWHLHLGEEARKAGVK